MKTLVTIGHSTRTIEQFLNLLNAYGIQELVDMRTVPKSRHNPQFGQDFLAPALDTVGIGYTHLKQLGGLRHPAKDFLDTPIAPMLHFRCANTSTHQLSFLCEEKGK